MQLSIRYILDISYTNSWIDIPTMTQLHTVDFKMI